MTYFYLKAVHIIFVVTWFAGLFYLPRLFIYIIEANTRPDLEKKVLQQQLTLMASRLLYGITWPSAIITLCMGTSLLITVPSLLKEGFMHLKLTLVFFLYLYHCSLQYIFSQLKKGNIRYTSQQIRIWNEVSTLFLISIVFLIVLRNALSMIWGLIGLLVVTLGIFAGIRLYKTLRRD